MKEHQHECIIMMMGFQLHDNSLLVELPPLFAACYWPHQRE